MDETFNINSLDADDYNTAVSQSPSMSADLQLTQLETRQQKSVHLITWSMADDSLLPNQDANPRDCFGRMVEHLFNLKKTDCVMHWTCSKEFHQRHGYHFHVAIQFKSKIRWLAVSNDLRAMKIYVNFQSFHSSYKDAYNYVTKEDQSFVTSANHPQMFVIPPKLVRRKRALSLEFLSQQSDTSSEDANEVLTDSHVANSTPEIPSSAAIASESSSASSSVKKTKNPRLTNIQVSQIIVRNAVKTDLQLCALATQFMKNDQPELYNWVAGHQAEKYREDLIKTSWKLHGAEEAVKQSNMPRIEKLEAQLTADHAADEENGLQCDGRWLEAALEILRRNHITIARWQELVTNCLRFGRNKKNNIFLVGERNCGKSFLLRPLTIIYDTFCNPASGSFNWVGAHSKEVILLNDFRYPPVDKGADKIISWQDLLNLCDADKLHIQAPKSFFAENIEWTAKQPIFGNGPRQISYIRNGIEDIGETSQMNARMVYVHLHYPIPEENLDHSILPCARCFAHLILNGSDIEQD
jgi:hypothetical protein